MNVSNWLENEHNDEIGRCNCTRLIRQHLHLISMYSTSHHHVLAARDYLQLKMYCCNWLNCQSIWSSFLSRLRKYQELKFPCLLKPQRRSYACDNVTQFTDQVLATNQHNEWNTDTVYYCSTKQYTYCNKLFFNSMGSGLKHALFRIDPGCYHCYVLIIILEQICKGNR